MTNPLPEILLSGPPKKTIVDGLRAFTVHRLNEADDRDALLRAVGPRIRAVASSVITQSVGRDLLERLPNLEIISTFGVGYDHIDVACAAKRGVVVTNTPDVLTEEVADTSIGLLLCTVRELPKAERHVRSGKWPRAGFPLTRASLRDRTVGLVGMGAIGQAIARRLDAMRVPVAYHTRRPVAGLPYRYYPDLMALARDVTVLLVIVPGGAATKDLIDARVLEALGPDGILINMARGSVVDEPALIEALRTKAIMAAGLDVYADEPHVPPELIAMENVVLLPHVGSASVYTRTQMDQLVVDNLLAWAAGKPPLTPVPETPWRVRS